MAFFVAGLTGSYQPPMSPEPIVSVGLYQGLCRDFLPSLNGGRIVPPIDIVSMAIAENRFASSGLATIAATAIMLV
jgi:hypothetical protein